MRRASSRTRSWSKFAYAATKFSFKQNSVGPYMFGDMSNYTTHTHFFLFFDTLACIHAYYMNSKNIIHHCQHDCQGEKFQGGNFDNSGHPGQLRTHSGQIQDQLNSGQTNSGHIINSEQNSGHHKFRTELSTYSVHIHVYVYLYV